MRKAILENSVLEEGLKELFVLKMELWEVCDYGCGGLMRFLVTYQ